MKNKRIILIFSVGIACLLIVSSYSSNNIYTNILNDVNNNRTVVYQSPKTSAAPTFSIDSPSNYSLFGKIAPNYSLTITAGGNFTWYKFLDLGVNETPIELEGTPSEYIEEPFNQTMWNNLDNGTSTVRFYVNNSLGETGYKDAILRIDIINPTLMINSPQNLTRWNMQPNIQVTATDPNLDSVWYVASGTKILLDNGVSEPFDSSIWSGLSDEGQFIVNFFANDSAGNINNTYTLTLYKDVVTPTLSIDSPANYTYWNAIPNIQVTASDTYFDSVWYVASGTKILLESGVSEPFDSSIWSGLSDESEFTINFYANDSAGNVNNTYSLTLYKDVVTPTLSIDSPANYTYWNAIPNIQVTVSDTYFDSVWYVASGTKILLESGVSEPFDSSIWSSLSDEGLFTINFFANDSAGNINNTYTLTLYKDVVMPTLSIDSPANYTYWNAIPNIQVTASDTYFDSVWYVASGTKILLESGVSEPFDSSIWSGLSDESEFTINFYANDSAGNVNNTYTLTLYKDVVTPTLGIDSPANYTYWNSIPDVQVTVSDTYFDSVWYVASGTKILLESGVSEPFDSSIWSGLSDESEFTINFYANDSAGNINNTYTLTLYKDVVTPTLGIDSPANYTYWNSIPDIQVTVSDTYFDSVWYVASGTKILLESGVSEPFDSSIWSGLSDESEFTINFYANDSAGNVNNTYTLTLYKDVVTPTLSIDSPANYTYWNSIPDVQVTVSDTYFDSVWYVASGTKILLESGVSEFFDSSIWNGLSDEGLFTINFFANDSAGNLNNTYTLSLYKDVVTPTLNINSPANYTYWNSIPDIQVTVSDTYFDSVWYVASGTKILLESGVSEPFDFSIWSGLSDEGQFIVNFFANDSAGNVNNTYTLSLYKDVVTPTLNINSPANYTYWNSIPDIQVTAFDTYFDSVWYVASGTKILLESGVSEPFDPSIWSGLSDEGLFTVNIFANDSAGNINNTYTLSLYKDIVTPTLNINSPANYTYWNTIPDIQVTAFDTFFDSVWYVASGTKILLESGVSEPFDSSIWSGLPDEGPFTINFFANDSAGNVNNTYTLNLYKDIVTPTLNINSPANNTYWNVIPNIQVTVSDTYFDAVWYVASGTKILLESGVSEPFNSSIWSTLPDEGLFTINFYANDSAGNVNNTYTLNLYKDVVTPTLSIDSPTDNTYWNFIPNIQVTVSDMYFDAVWYVASGSKILLESGVSEPFDSSIWSGLSDESEFTINFYANDSAGNINNTYSFTLYKDIVAPRLIVQNPLNHTYCNTPPPINITVYELDFYFLTYTVIGYTPDTIRIYNNTEVLLNEEIWDKLSQGKFIISVTAYDNLDQTSDLIINVYKDTIAPSIMINSPVNNTFWNLAPSLNITAFDPNLDSIWYSVYNVNITLQNSTIQQLNSSIWNGLPDEGEFEVQIYANDSFGHLNDNLTLTLYKDVVAPTLIINSPLNNTYHKVAPIINVTVMDPYFHSLWYRVETQNIPLTNNTNQQLDSSIWNGLPVEGEFIIYFYANDSTGNLNNSYIFRLHRDIRNPEITINNPNLNDFFGEPAPDFEIFVSELNLNQTWYMLYNQTWNSLNYSFTGLAGKISQVAWNEFFNGNITIRFYANDTLNNLNYTEVTIRKNLNAPIITIVNPNDNDLIGIEAPNITIYKAGLELNTTWYTLDGGSTNFTFTGLSVVVNQAAWAIYGFADVTITFYINDSLGRVGFDEVTLRKDPDPPEVSITFITPSNNSYYYMEPTFRITAVDPNLDSIWYRVGNTNISVINDVDIVLNDSIWNSLPQGKFTIEVFAVDILGYMNDSLTLTFYKDTLDPIIVVNQPTEYDYYNSPPPINVTVYEPTLDFLIYTVVGDIHGPIPLSNNSEELLSQLIWDDLPQGEFLISITAFDEFGQNNSIVITVYKDTIAPSITINLPLNNTFWNSSPFLNVTAFDPNLDTIWYRANSINITVPDNTLKLLNDTFWASLGEGAFTIEFFANDTNGYTSTAVNLTLIKDTTIPQITVNSPNNSTYYSIAPTMDISMSDLNPDSIWYTVMGTKVILSGVEALNPTIWNSLGQGEFQVYIFANDSAGNLNNSVILTLYKDTLAPLVTVNLPLNNTYWSDNLDLIFNVMAYDPNLASIYYQVLGRPRRYLTNNTDTVFSLLDWVPLPEGLFLVDIFAEDSLSNINNSIRLTLYKDTVDPVINIISPQPNEIYGEIPPNFEISIIEDHLNSTWYVLIGESTTIPFTGFNGTIDLTTWNLFGNGTVTIRFYSNDTAGNTGHSDITIRKNIYAPIITINSPGDNDLFGITAPNFIIYKSGAELNTTWYTLDIGLTNITFTGLSGTINQTVWENFDFETVTVRFYINDTFGKVGFDEVSIRKDPDMPIIIVNSPNNHTAYASSPFIDLTIIEPNLDKVWYRINTIIIDITANFTQFINFPTWNSLPQGEFIVELFANDTMGNINNFTTLYLSKDTIGPNITIIRPTENQKVGRNAPTFDLLISDDHSVDLRWYTIGIGGTPREFTDLVGIIDQNLWEQIWDDSTQGEIIIIRFYAEDALGNEDYKEINLIVEKPLDLPRYLSEPLGLLISSLTLAVMVPVTVKLVKSRYYKALNVKVKRRLRKVLISAAFFLSLLTLYFIF